MRNLSGDERKLLVIQFFNFLSYSLAGVFVNVFFFANSNLTTTILYNIINMGFFTFFYALSGWMLRKISSGVLMKLSFLVAALFYFFLFYLREKSVAFILPLGIISGFSGGVYWSAYNLNQYIISHSSRRAEYFGWASAAINLASALGPVVGGSLIAAIGGLSLSLNAGYAVLFFLVFLIMIAAVVAIGKLPSHGALQFSYRHIITHQRSRRWKLVLAQQGLLGFYDVAVGTVTGILLFLVLGGEAPFGLALTVAAGLATVASLISIVFLKRFRSGFWVGAIGAAVAFVLFGLFQNTFGVWAFIVISGLTGAFFQNALSIEFFGALDAGPGGWQQKYHMMLEQAMILSIPRLISFTVLFFLLQLGNEVAIARTWLLFLPIFPLAIGFLLHKSVLSAQRE
ncbi:MFS transporter [Candidatus Gottesmanbacteria bacterium]|nr:MFS transporter [Candidatus Gottesmanbacteria bacterium]